MIGGMATPLDGKRERPDLGIGCFLLAWLIVFLLGWLLWRSLEDRDAAPDVAPEAEAPRSPPDGGPNDGGGPRRMTRAARRRRLQELELLLPQAEAEVERSRLEAAQSAPGSGAGTALRAALERLGALRAERERLLR